MIRNQNGYEEHTNRGFTDHEHLDDAELIHMKGRVYDYNLGRFLSVDPFIQSPGNSQSMNPYSYIMNNPLAGTDPSGYRWNTKRPRYGFYAIGIPNGAGTTGFSCSTALECSKMEGKLRLDDVNNKMANIISAWNVKNKKIQALNVLNRLNNPSISAEPNDEKPVEKSDVAGTSGDKKVSNFQLYADPTDDLDNEIYPNSVVQGKSETDTDYENKVISLRMNLTAGWDKRQFTEGEVKKFIADIEAKWGNVSYKIGELTYKLSVGITLGAGFNKGERLNEGGDINFHACLKCSGAGNEAQADRGGSNIYVLMNKTPGAIAHEFGHVLGLGHRLNSTGSIQSYSANNWKVTQDDLLKVFSGYAN